MRRWRDPLAIVALFLLAFSIGRLLLLAVHWPTFSDLSGLRLARGLVHGARFDLSMTLLLVGLPVWLMAIPAGWARSRRWQAPWRWFCFAALVVCLFLIAADLVYFSTVGRHVGSELALALGSDAGALVRMPLDYPLVLGAYVLVAIGLAMVWRRLGRREARADGTDGAAGDRHRALTGQRRWAAWGLWVAAAPLLVLGVRGGWQEKPINIVNAFEHGSVAEGQLTLNAPFSAYHSTRNTRSSAGLDAMPPAEATRVVRAGFALEGQRWTSERHPLERAFAANDPPGPPRNVVVLVLESWDALLTDAIRSREGLPPLGLTPEFDALAEEGLLLTRFHAAGQRSIEGIGALLAGVPTLPGMPYMGQGMEQSRLSFLGGLAGRNGYRTVFVRSARRGSYRLDALARLAGFEEYAGAEDILREPSHTRVESGYWGAWDFDSLRFLHETLMADRGADDDASDSSGGDPPFLAFFFGSSTHVPYPLPGDQWEIRPGDTPEARFRNTVHYVDWALGRFIRMARDSGYYENTLFLVVADQTSAFAPTDPLPARHWIPALLVGPGIPADTVDSRVASHLDVLPTIVDYLGWTDPYAALGESVLGVRRPGALLKQGDLMLRMGTDGWVAHDLARRLEGAGDAATRDSLERLLLAETQLVMELLRSNRVYSGG